MSKYILEHEQEAQRLERQSQLAAFSLEKELEHIYFHQDQFVLDAGCGTGLLRNYLLHKYPHLYYVGVDQSADRIAHHQKNKQMEFYQLNLEDLNSLDFLRGSAHECSTFIKAQQGFDTILSRYVMHHLSDAQKLLSNLKKCLKPGGRLVLIDCDGILTNLGTLNTTLLSMLEKINIHFQGKLSAASKLPAELNACGFKDISYDIQTVNFQGISRQEECLQYRQRITFAKHIYIEALGSEAEYEKFLELYLSEFSKEHVSMYYSKFIITATN
jgi:SAM-dependent methyltransferase